MGVYLEEAKHTKIVQNEPSCSAVSGLQSLDCGSSGLQKRKEKLLGAASIGPRSIGRSFGASIDHCGGWAGLADWLKIGGGVTAVIVKPSGGATWNLSGKAIGMTVTPGLEKSDSPAAIVIEKK